MIISLAILSKGEKNQIVFLARKKKLIGNWVKSGQASGEATMVLYNTVNAFKFPDNAQVFLTCNVEVGRLLFMFMCSQTLKSVSV